MSMDQERYIEHILKLITKFTKGEATEAEIQEIDQWYDNPASSAKYSDGLSEGEKLRAKEKLFRRINLRIYSEASPDRKIISFSLAKSISIAAILFVIFGAALFYIMPYFSHHPPRPLTVKSGVKPGGNKAVLTLANGKKIILTNAKNGVLATQANAVINKTADGKIVYNSNKSQNSETDYNVMSTPKGGEYHLTLSDGTNVWLNAASSIRYPTVFSGKERVVEITGEAYFEVNHNAKMPFKVMANGNLIEDIGTHFNVNSYTDESSLKTTLLEGSVKIYSGENSIVLVPGEQSQIRKDITGITVIHNADLKEAIGWKDGVFRFHDTEISEVMRQISRWYAIEIKYQGNLKNKKFSGEILRESDINKVFEMLAFFKINCRILETNTRKIIIVSNK
ncbi:MAG: FecR family protein [Bacteroidota bacterium]|nr:FecR family protein [Bacteroidota bacterium]